MISYINSLRNPYIGTKLREQTETFTCQNINIFKMFFSNAMLDYYTIYMRLAFDSPKPRFGAQVAIWQDQFMHPLGMKPTPMFCTIWWEPSGKKSISETHPATGQQCTIFQKTHFLALQLGSLIHDDFILFFWEKINFQHNNLNGSTLKKTTNQPDLS